MKKPPGPDTHWGQVAAWYDQLVGDEGSEYHREVVIPGVLRLLGEVKGKRILDVACGQGVLCRALAERGAEVTGVDAARELVDAARERGPGTIRYECGDVRDLSFLPAGGFDGATCVLAIQNIDPLPGMLTSAGRALGDAGRMVIVMTHPCFRGPKESSWGWEGGTQYRRVDRYLIPRKAPMVIHPGKKDGTYTWSFHRPLEMYVRALARAGFAVDALEEWTSHKQSEPGPRAAAENRARKEIPLFLALRAVKTGVALRGGERSS